MEQAVVGPAHSFLAGLGSDAAGRKIGQVLDLPDAKLESIHDYIQWLFPLPTRSMAQPQSPVLTRQEVEAIRDDQRALANIDRAAARMLAFYKHNDAWLSWSDHNHLRISRILQSLRILRDLEAARQFHQKLIARAEETGADIDPRNRRYWDAAIA